MASLINSVVNNSLVCLNNEDQQITILDKFDPPNVYKLYLQHIESNEVIEVETTRDAIGLWTYKCDNLSTLTFEAICTKVGTEIKTCDGIFDRIALYITNVSGSDNILMTQNGEHYKLIDVEVANYSTVLCEYNHRLCSRQQFLDIANLVKTYKIKRLDPNDLYNISSLHWYWSN